MTRGQQAAAAAAVAIAAVAAWWAWQGGGSATLKADASLDTTGCDEPGGDDAGELAGRIARHQAAYVPGAVHPRHALYRRHDGHKMRKHLMTGGWDWYLNPPGEANL